MDIFGDKTIKAGDLAMVVRDCCGRYLGKPVKVTGMFFVAHPSIATCDHCHREYSNVDVVSVTDAGKMCYSPLFWLKKIDPPALTETEDEREELTA